jgi:phospholipid-binding lipoprotein MlaA
LFATALLALAACSVPEPGTAPGSIHDPHEAENRRVHDFNRAVDARFLRGAGAGFSQTVPDGLEQTVGNVADTLSLPRTVVNQVLQGRPGDATRNVLRFAVNATLGFGGLADVATDIGLQRDESDFGETLHVWGLPEGGYLELPLYGPSTERDAAGLVVDLFLDPFSHVLTAPQRRTVTAIRIADEVSERGQFSGTYDSVLYGSADSYAQLRLLYLQNRRFELGMQPPAEEAIDPFAIDTEGF